MTEERYLAGKRHSVEVCLTVKPPSRGMKYLAIADGDEELCGFGPDPLAAILNLERTLLDIQREEAYL